MGLMDKVKAQATQLAQKTQETARDGMARFDQAQAGRRADDLLRNLGAAVYAQQTGKGGPDTQAQIDKLVADISAHEAQNGINLGSNPADQADQADQAGPGGVASGFPADAGVAGFPADTGTASFPPQSGFPADAGFPAEAGVTGFPADMGTASFPADAGFPPQSGFPADTGTESFPPTSVGEGFPPES